jgi:hypothetical protein
MAATFHNPKLVHEIPLSGKMCTQNRAGGVSDAVAVFAPRGLAGEPGAVACDEVVDPVE